jgi:hypothetical protein
MRIAPTSLRPRRRAEPRPRRPHPPKALGKGLGTEICSHLHRHCAFFRLAASFIGEMAKVVPATHASAVPEVERAMIPSTFGPIQSETKRIGVNGQR